MSVQEQQQLIQNLFLKITKYNFLNKTYFFGNLIRTQQCLNLQISVVQTKQMFFQNVAFGCVIVGFYLSLIVLKFANISCLDKVDVFLERGKLQNAVLGQFKGQSEFLLLEIKLQHTDN
eukprot:TRINITY_DN7691_c0_g1_i4.p4 TRINITY_DN7691_c0_g1~~TRINITY_DN7691_c0_g1_i4.p4  ORF type:complete len:119 (-),score=0.10 TRINITY_DN7691_c0_g1_i4:205-561(-)